MRPGDHVASAIAASGVGIYDSLVGRPELVYDLPTLEARLNAGLRGLRLNYPLRTRAKVTKSAVAAVLGYPVPTSFGRTQPRFPGQNLDVYVQKADNLQIWNEEVSALRRYALIRVNDSDVVVAVRVLTGEAIALLDPAGTLTTKYQAKRRPGKSGSLLVTPQDTTRFRHILIPGPLTAEQLAHTSTVTSPKPRLVFPIAEIHRRMIGLVGARVRDPGLLQDRNRGVALQKLVGRVLDIPSYADIGQFPDVLSQALEVKLQLSSTIDLGLVTPDSTTSAPELGDTLRHCDVRYSVVYATRTGENEVLIREVVTSTGEGFFSEFQRFEGLVQNAKLQIPLPRDLFNAERLRD